VDAALRLRYDVVGVEFGVSVGSSADTAVLARVVVAAVHCASTLVPVRRIAQTGSPPKQLGRLRRPS